MSAAKSSHDKYRKFESSIDANRHSSKLQEVAERRRRDDEEEEYLMEEGEYEIEDGEHETDSRVESEISLSEGEPALNIGTIDLSFPETTEEFQDSPQCYPPSYYTLSPKERLLLLYAENFRKQFVLKYPRRRAMVLALPNECNVQVK